MWVPFVVLVLISAVLTISMLRGGKLGRRWYTGGQSWNDRDRQGGPVDRTDNESTKQWGGTTLDD